MLIHVVKSKIHRVKVTGAELNYIGSITIDKDLLDAANIVEGEKVQVVNNNNGERLETYAIPGPRGSGEITLNGAAARKVSKGDILILKSSVNYAHRTSMEIGVRIDAENPLTGELRHTATAYLTFVAIDKNNKPSEISKIKPVTENEKRRYNRAKERHLQRRKKRNC